MKTKEVLNSILTRFERGDIPEIVAELSSASLCYLVGRRPERTLGNSYRYIKTYAEKANLSPYSACQKVLALT